MILNRQLGKRLGAAIEASGLPRPFVARMISIAPQTLAAYIRGGIPQLEQEVYTDLADTLEHLVSAEELPLELHELALIGLNYLSERHADSQ